jgi:GT2 family glycosyltransferase
MADRSPRSQLSQPKASVIVLNRNGLRFLDQCLGAVLAQQLDGSFEVLLVDNGSSDESVACVRERFPQVRIVDLAENLGFAGGNDRGFREARAEHVVLLNNDTRVRAGWLAALVAAAEADPRVGAVTSKLVFLDRPDTIQNAGSLLLSDGSGADRGFEERDRGQYERREEVFAACGGAMLVKRRVLDDVGDLDETFFAYYEDTDLSWRMRLRGWRIVYEPAAVVEHVHAGTSEEWSPFFTFHAFRNRLFMILKNAPPGFAVKAFARFGWLAAVSVARGLLRRLRGRRVGAQGQERRGASQVRTYVRIVLSLLEHLPEMLAKRWRIRRGRRVADAEIRRWLYPRERWDTR